MTWVDPVHLVLSSWFFLSGFHFELPLIVPHPACLHGLRGILHGDISHRVVVWPMGCGGSSKVRLSLLPQSGRFQYRSVLEALTTIASTDGPRGKTIHVALVA